MLEREVVEGEVGLPGRVPEASCSLWATPPHYPLVALVVLGLRMKGPFWNPVAVVTLSRKPVGLSQIRVSVPI